MTYNSDIHELAKASEIKPPKTGGSVKPVIWWMVQTFLTWHVSKGKGRTPHRCRVALDCWSQVLVSFMPNIAWLNHYSLLLDVVCQLVGESYLDIVGWFCRYHYWLQQQSNRSLLVVRCLLLVSSLFVQLLLSLRMAMSQYQRTKKWWMSFPAKTILYLFSMFTRGTTFWLHS